MKRKIGLVLVGILVLLAILPASVASGPPAYPEVGGNCDGAWVEVHGGDNKKLTVWIDGNKVFQQKVSDGFEKSATMEQLGLDPCVKHKIKAKYAGEVAKAKFGGPKCCPGYPEVGGGCKKAWVKVHGGHNKLLKVWIDGNLKLEKKVSSGFEISRTLEELGLDPCERHKIKAKYAGNTDEDRFGGDHCCPSVCQPRLYIWVNGCVPHGLTISGWWEFNENLYQPDGKPTGKKYPMTDRPWEGNPYWADLKKQTAFRFFGWTAEGGFVHLSNVTTTKECPVGGINVYYTFPCPAEVPTPTPTPLPAPRKLPVTGGYPPPGVNPGLIVATLGLILGGGVLAAKRRKD